MTLRSQQGESGNEISLLKVAQFTHTFIHLATATTPSTMPSTVWRTMSPLKDTNEFEVQTHSIHDSEQSIIMTSQALLHVNRDGHNGSF